jgi:drug/metabolite transporter (DMT)-like permease
VYNPSSRLWFLGFAIFITSNVLGSVFQIGALSITLLAPLGAVSLLWNAFFARILLGDVFSRYLIFGETAFAGVVLVMHACSTSDCFATIPQVQYS